MGDVLPLELEQLGPPRDICKAIVKEYGVASANIRTYLTTQILHLPRVKSTAWRADYIISSSECKSVSTPFVSVQWKLSKPLVDGRDSLTFEMSSRKCNLLYNDLKAVQALMNQIE